MAYSEKYWMVTPVNMKDDIKFFEQSSRSPILKQNPRHPNKRTMLRRFSSLERCNLSVAKQSPVIFLYRPIYYKRQTQIVHNGGEFWTVSEIQLWGLPACHFFSEGRHQSDVIRLGHAAPYCSRSFRPVVHISRPFCAAKMNLLTLSIDQISTSKISKSGYFDKILGNIIFERFKGKNFEIWTQEGNKILVVFKFGLDYKRYRVSLWLLHKLQSWVPGVKKIAFFLHHFLPIRSK